MAIYRIHSYIQTKLTYAFTAAASSLTAGSGTISNPCAAYATGSPGSAPTGSSGAGATTGAGSGSSGATGTSSGTSASSTAKSAAPKVGAGLKVYLGVALVGALAVLSM